MFDPTETSWRRRHITERKKSPSTWRRADSFSGKRRPSRQAQGLLLVLRRGTTSELSRVGVGSWIR